MDDTRVFSYSIDEADAVISVNADFADFAVENGAPSLPDAIIGRPLWDFISDTGTAELYRLILSGVRESARPVSVEYRCDGPAVRRFMELRIRPSEGAAGHVLFESRVLRLEPREPPQPFLGRMVPLSKAAVFICSRCKKIKVSEDLWAEIEEAAAAMDVFKRDTLPNPIHSICRPCIDAMRSVCETLRREAKAYRAQISIRREALGLRPFRLDEHVQPEFRSDGGVCVESGSPFSGHNIPDAAFGHPP